MRLKNILVTPLMRIETPGGDVMHAMKESDAGYVGFGEAYFSWVSGGVIKAWKRHTKTTMNVVVPVGKVRFVFCSIDASGNKDFRVEEIGIDRFMKDVTEGKLTQKLFFNEKGEYDYDKMFKINFLAENFDQIQKYYKGKVKTETTRSVINDLQNVQIDKPTGTPQTDSAPKSNFDHWADSKLSK